MIKKLLLIFIFGINLFALPPLEEPSVLDNEGEVKKIENFPLPKYLENNQPQVKPKSIFLSYEEDIKSVYVNEIFKLTVKVIAALQNPSFSYNFLGGKDYELKNPSAFFHQIDNNQYTITFYFKLKTPSAVLPNIKITATNKNGYKESDIIPRLNIKIIPLKEDPEFCGVLADNLNVKNLKTTTFDEKSYMFVMKINYKRANIEDFKIKWTLKDKIEEKKGDFLEGSILYLAYIPPNTKYFNFKYFNLQKKRFEYFSYPVVLKKDELSTQLDLNPKASRFDIYKDSVLGILAIGFLILFILKIRKNQKIGYLYLLLTLLLSGYIIYDQLPFLDKIVKKETRVRILPTENSTIFYTVKKDVKVKVLNRRGKYVKVMFPDNKIGWVKDEDLR